MVEISTDKGLIGYGLGGGGLAGALVIDQHLQHFLLGQDPLDVVQIWDQLYHLTSLSGICVARSLTDPFIA
jgi:L-rhamnonate dehydratase